jgi:hypothetical protein
MEIIFENLPEINDETNLIIDSSILSKNPQIIYNNTNENTENKNELLINQNKYKFNSIFKELETEKISDIIINQINVKNI